MKRKEEEKNLTFLSMVYPKDNWTQKELELWYLRWELGSAYIDSTGRWEPCIVEELFP